MNVFEVEWDHETALEVSREEGMAVACPDRPGVHYRRPQKGTFDPGMKVVSGQWLGRVPTMKS